VINCGEPDLSGIINYRKRVRDIIIERLKKFHAPLQIKFFSKEALTELRMLGDRYRIY
jgi:hypothetical protein